MLDIDTELLKPVAAKFNLSLTSFGKAITDPSAPSYGSVTLSNPWGTQLEPAPISPYKDSAAFDLLSGTIKSVYNTHRGLEGDDNIQVYPSYITGNTGRTNPLFLYASWPAVSHTDRHQILLEVVGEYLSIQPRKRHTEGKSGKHPHRQRVYVVPVRIPSASSR